MATPIQIDGSTAQGALDSLFGTAGSALDLWSKWSNQKIENTAAKAAIPSTVLQPTPRMDGSSISNKTLAIGGAIAAGLLILVLFVTGRRRK